MILALLLCAMRPASADTLRIGGTGAALGLVKWLGEGFAGQHGGLRVEVPKSLGSTGGIQALLAGVLDIAVSSRPLKDAERSAGARLFPMGVTPLAVVTARKDWQRGVTSGELVQWFGLYHQQWPDGVPLYVVLRPKSETDFNILAASIPGMKGALDRAWNQAGLPLAFTDQDNLDMAERLDGSLAVSALSAVLTEHRQLTILALDGVSPTVDNLERGSYRLKRPIYLVTGERTLPIVEAFMRFVRGREGQRILRSAGTLPHS